MRIRLSDRRHLSRRNPVRDRPGNLHRLWCLREHLPGRRNFTGLILDLDHGQARSLNGPVARITAIHWNLQKSQSRGGIIAIWTGSFIGLSQLTFPVLVVIVVLAWCPARMRQNGCIGRRDDVDSIPRSAFPALAH